MRRIKTEVLLLMMGSLFFPSCSSEDVFNSGKVKEFKITPQVDISRSGKMSLASGESFDITLAITLEEKRKGLSGVRDSQWEETKGLLFTYLDSKPRSMWMPDTYFNLDIFFLDEKGMVLDVERDVEAHPGYSDNPPIAVTRQIECVHVLELKSSSPIAMKIKKGDVITLQSPDKWPALMTSLRFIAHQIPFHAR